MATLSSCQYQRGFGIAMAIGMIYCPVYPWAVIGHQQPWDWSGHGFCNSTGTGWTWPNKNGAIGIMCGLSNKGAHKVAVQEDRMRQLRLVPVSFMSDGEGWHNLLFFFVIIHINASASLYHGLCFFRKSSLTSLGNEIGPTAPPSYLKKQ